MWASESLRGIPVGLKAVKAVLRGLRSDSCRLRGDPAGL